VYVSVGSMPCMGEGPVVFVLSRHVRGVLHFAS